MKKQLVKESLNEGSDYYEPLYNSIEDIKDWDYIDADIALTNVIEPTLKKCKELMSNYAFESFMKQLKNILEDYE
jgi:hypothetical protein